MGKQVPQNPLQLVKACYGKLFPEVHRELSYWEKKAKNIPNEELRTQALSSLSTKAFHCEGGSAYALLAKDQWRTSVRFIVAYQTISDYLDNLCDRSTSLDPKDFEQLHKSLTDALSPNMDEPLPNYYQYREDQDDGGYLHELVNTCQVVLQSIENLHRFQSYLHKLASYYSELQVHKHVKVDERLHRLTSWFQHHQRQWPNLSWYEFSASAGSTLGVFCLVSYGLRGDLSDSLWERVYNSYFPYVQGLHILLEYYIDQIEDMREGDLNFCSYYDSNEELKQRILYFHKQGNIKLQELPDYAFHHLIQNGLIGMYLADQKLKEIDHGKKTMKALLKAAGGKAKFFYVNTKLYQKFKVALM
ncbi:tetraprenyl-beta-curcumene synthase family protein [Salirhabdus salicampi]|uniref:tetraprenyl-beta-curcumene synthase family protein n=1 Tax=Salirhabdus salicampi TaxID=476102 RepID=UPI0020C1BF1E|nr:tetraprenyl-beta-curcumene synthase family protein [Salirhabdus salicampi]MCP8617809.1 tetraprenyl-beta-curcumene synthase family protein [Salirhabdus salicampi]